LVDQVDSTRKTTLKLPQLVKRVVPDYMPPVPPHCARIAKKASFKNWLNQLNTIVNFVSRGKLFKTKPNPAPLALMGNIKTATFKPVPRAKRVRPVFIPSIPPPCARIAKKASFKNWLNQLNTIVNFVPKQQHSIRPIAVVFHVPVANFKHKIQHLRSRANNAWLALNGKRLPSFAIRALMENTKMKTTPIQFLVNFVLQE
jgi:hypothetical protein